MATIQKPKKATTKAAPKMMAGEMTGKMYKKSEIDEIGRKQAAEFSFFLAVPTMFAATVYKMYKFQKEHTFNNDDLLLLFIGNIVAFVVAMIAIKAFISFLTKYGFKAFGYYRIALGLILLILLFAGVDIQLI
jgi:undecaprenyl-diphosphatase